MNKHSEANWAMGTHLYIGGYPSGTHVCELTNINGLELDSDEIDVTNHCSVGGYEEVIQSIRRTGTVSLEGNFIPGDPGQQLLYQDYMSGAIDDYSIVFPAAMATQWNFRGFVKKAPSTEAPYDGKVSMSAEIRVTGKPDLIVNGSSL